MVNSVRIGGVREDTPPHTHSGIGYQLEGLSDEVAFEHRGVR